MLKLIQLVLKQKVLIWGGVLLFTLPGSFAATSLKNVKEVHWFRVWVSGVAKSALKNESRDYFLQKSDPFYEWLSGPQNIQELIQEAGLSEFKKPLELFSRSVTVTLSERLGLPEPAIDLTLDQASKKLSWKSLSSERRTQILQSLPASFWKGLSRSIVGGIGSIQIQDAPAVQALLDPESGFNIEEPMRSTIEAVLTNYFREIPIENRVLMIANVLGLPQFASVSDQLAVVLFETGPTLQKLFQLVGDQAESKDIRLALKKLRDQIPPIEGGWVQKTIHERLGPDGMKKIRKIYPKAIASGTVGQVHKAELVNGETVIIKLRRPDVIEKMETEFEVLYRIVKDHPLADQVIQKLETTLREEIDFRVEADHLKKGEIYQTAKGDITIANRHPGFKAFEDLLILEQASGVPFHRAESEYDALKTKRLKKLMEIWFREAIFKSGFFHGDLHGGNIFFDPEQNGKITLIDFGNTGYLTVLQRRGLVRMIIAAMINNPSEMFKALNQFSPIPSDLEVAVQKQVNLVFASSGSMDERLNKTLPEVIRLGVDVPSAIVSFFRAKEFLERQYHELVGPNQALRVFLAVTAQEVGKSLPLQFFSKKIRKNSPFTWRELGFLTRFGLIELTRRIGDCSSYLLPKQAVH